jgi:hypothetical protein
MVIPTSHAPKGRNTPHSTEIVSPFSTSVENHLLQPDRGKCHALSIAALPASGQSEIQRLKFVSLQSQITFRQILMEAQIYLWSDWRRHLIKRHDFYVSQVKSRLLSQFDDIEGEADRFGEAEYERIGQLPGSEDFDRADAADVATGNSQEFYALLSDLKDQTILGAVAGMYHQWDKDLRDFLEKELRHYLDQPTLKKVTWLANVEDVLDVLRQFGWDCVPLPFYKDIDACRLVVNVFKHGKGNSLDNLSQKYPQYLAGGLPTYEFMKSHLDHEALTVTTADLDKFSDSIKAFWTDFPERLYLFADPAGSILEKTKGSGPAGLDPCSCIGFP